MSIIELYFAINIFLYFGILLILPSENNMSGDLKENFESFKTVEGFILSMLFGSIILVYAMLNRGKNHD